MAGNVLSYTANINLARQRFDMTGWHSGVNDNFSILDATVGGIPVVLPNKGIWQNATAYIVGDRVVDEDNGKIYRCAVAHTSATSGTFSSDRVAHTTYWAIVSIHPGLSGTWTTGIGYLLNEIVIYSSTYYICTTAHTAGTFATDLAADKWALLFDMGFATSAETVAGTNATKPVHSAGVQAAIISWLGGYPDDLTGLRAGLGINNVDNTHDVDKPVSTAQQTALDGKAPWIGADTTITVQAGASDMAGAFSTLQNAFDLYLDKAIIAPQATVTINVVGQVDCGSSILSMRHPNWQRIKLRGTDPLVANVTGVTSVTGSRGAYLATIQLDTVAGIAPGMWVMIDNIPAVSPTQGGQAAPVAGQFAFGLCNAASSQVLAYISLADPTHVTFSGSVAGLVTPGVSVLRCQGQTRLVTALSGDGTVATVNAAFNQGQGNLVYWQLLVAENGTCSTTNGNLTISGMDATQRASPGDVVLMADGSDVVAWVNSVPSAGQINTSRTFTAAAGSNFVIVNCGPYAHSGAFCVESVNVGSNTITVRNTAAAEWTIGRAGITAGRCRVLTSVLRATSSGIAMLDGVLDCNSLAIVGGSGPTTIGASGIGMSAVGTGRGFASGASVVVAGWGTGYYVHDGATCSAISSFIARNSYAGVDVSRASANLDSCYFHGNVQYDILGDMSGVRVSRLLSSGSGMTMRGQVGFAPYADWPRIWGASDTAVLFENDCGGQVVGLVALACGRVGSSRTAIIDYQNGGKGRATGLATLGFYGPQAVACTTGRAELSEAVVSLGAIAFYAGALGDLDLQKAGAVCLSGSGYVMERLGLINATRSCAGLCSSGGYIVRNAKMVARYCATWGNMIGDYSAPDGDGGQIDCLGAVGTPNYVQTLNTWLKAGGYISDGTVKLT